MATHLATLLGAFLPLLLGAILWMRVRRKGECAIDTISPVTRQHIELFQGGQFRKGAVEAARKELELLLDRGLVRQAEATLRPGTQYAIQVRALAEIGTEAAARILEKQLLQTQTRDALDQSWYWIDLAGALRRLNRHESVPLLLRRLESEAEIPLAHFLAAETVCFPAFLGFLRQPRGYLGRAAMRTAHRAFEGLRNGVQPQVVMEARLGEAVEVLWDSLVDVRDPLQVRVFVEALRQLRRAPHAEAALANDETDLEGFRLQMARIGALEAAIEDYLREAPEVLKKALPDLPSSEQGEAIAALDDLHVDATDVLMPMLDGRGCEHEESALRLLRWSRDAETGAWLRARVEKKLAAGERTKRRRSRSVENPLPAAVRTYVAVIQALRGHPSADTARFLVRATQDYDPCVRIAASNSLGWWEPAPRGPLVSALQGLRHDENANVRHAARAALARLGEREALNGFRALLTSEEPRRVCEAIQAIAREGLTLLWPELDRLADSEDADVAYFAREATERMREELELCPAGS
jgi:HEAT repeat protein